MYTTLDHDASFTAKVVERLAASWDHRVAVRQPRLDLTQYCDDSIPEFPISMVPFWDDEDFAPLPHADKLRFLGAAWVAYNEKAMYLEDEIVQPLCSLLLKRRLPGTGDARLKQALAQIQVDEQFHILMCLEVCHCARERHRLGDLEVPEPLVGVAQRARLAAARDEREAAIVRLAYASVAEMSINAYLTQVSTDLSIQPLNRINTDLHRRDEAAHGTGFHEIVGSVYRALDAPGQAAFAAEIAAALDVFTTPDTTAWHAILAHLAVPHRERILARLDARNEGVRLSRDYATLRSLFDELGIAGLA
ncbi:diiron oxygenase [Burkholderia plantarii]|uniref:p-aminobenzoate N-oxygenase AurF n=1 Tax=Burkholderia plantarii TaxID=41899 RepID=A0A0B6RMJ0_BURPL|nr:diiron oxygenase [Burkholderia plantarii]AJK46537.1 hypothetical protein BGL_1c20280 [Burkholderia plantarii]